MRSTVTAPRRSGSPATTSNSAPGIGHIVGYTGLITATIDTVTQAILSVDFTAGHQDGTPFPALGVGLE